MRNFEDASTMDREIDEIVAQLKHDRIGRFALPPPRMYLIITDKYGKEIETIPPLPFDGLDKMINTGYTDET